jgi:hypothetical protein
MKQLPHLDGTLRPPDERELNLNLWVEQQIWGHRFLNDQTPWLLLLEALGVMASRDRKGKAESIFPGIRDGSHENVQYELPQRQHLRQVLFQQRDIEEIARNPSMSDDAMWAEWRGKLANSQDLAYLQSRFDTFASFASAVHLLRGCEVEPGRKRRATSRHLVPRGPDMLTADFDEKRGKINKDRRFFARGGELLFLMLNRSRMAAALDGPVRSRLLASHSRWNHLAKMLQPDRPPDPPDLLSFEGGCYLPLARHPVYDVLAEDWHALLELRALPDDHLPENLMRLSGLAVVRYLLERAAEVLREAAPTILVDMLAPDTGNLRRVSRDTLSRHRNLGRRAIERLVEDLVNSDDWHTAARKPKPGDALKKLIRERFAYSANANEAHGLSAELAQEAVGHYDDHLGAVMGFYAESIGLASSQRGRGRWYAASDAFLESLILANVTHPIELEEFLKRLHKRYKMVIGPEVGREVFENVNHDHLKANQRQFEERLRLLGFLKRLSDDCAFAQNPFWKAGAS